MIVLINSEPLNNETYNTLCQNFIVKTIEENNSYTSEFMFWLLYFESFCFKELFKSSKKRQLFLNP